MTKQKITKERFDGIKTLLNMKLPRKTIAEAIGCSSASVVRVNSAKNYENYLADRKAETARRKNRASVSLSEANTVKDTSSNKKPAEQYSECLRAINKVVEIQEKQQVLLEKLIEALNNQANRKRFFR